MHDAQVRELLAKEEIRQLPYRYAAAIETRDVDAMAELFAPHARFGDHGEGREALRRLMSASVDASLFAVILVANHLIELDAEDRAHGQVWAQCFAQTHTDGFVEQLIKYEDRYERHGGRWLFLHRRHRLFYGVSRRTSPLTQEAASWPRNQTGVGDLPLTDPVFTAWWQTNAAARSEGEQRL
ncbi:nuclear transport factor 2 family protein [Mycobacterium sp. UM_CSW]|uniref:nuclear transport factor 2 family protein n=1 Tax=Mycobacterium sp. UM_CSW TaxID=1370119 RepID=UPI0003FAF329|nr:nuclear transport factor 2 family protein [Mycobacterium sp. UM_CSW]